MAVQFTDFSRAPLLDSPFKNLLGDVLKGYKMSQEPAKMADESKERQLANQLKGLELEHKPKEYELDDKHKSLVNSLQSKALEHFEEKFGMERDLNKANIQRALKPTSLKGALNDAFQLRDNLDPNSPTYEEDKRVINNYLKKLGTVSGNNNFAQPAQAGKGDKVNLPGGKEGYVPGLGNMPKGWVPVTDMEGLVIGANVPLTPKQVEQYQAKEKFDVIYPFLNESLSEYTGEGSYERYVDDAKNYNKDAAAKRRIDYFMAAKKLLSIGTTSENARIGGHATNVQLRELKKSLDSSEVYSRLQEGSGFVLPAKYAQASGDIFKSYLDKVEEAAKKDIPAYQFRALNPGNKESDSHVGEIYNLGTQKWEKE